MSTVKDSHCHGIGQKPLEKQNTMSSKKQLQVQQLALFMKPIAVSFHNKCPIIKYFNWKKRKSLPHPLKNHFPINLPNFSSNLCPKPSSSTYAISGPNHEGIFVFGEGGGVIGRLTSEAARRKIWKSYEGKISDISLLIRSIVQPNA